MQQDGRYSQMWHRFESQVALGVGQNERESPGERKNNCKTNKLVGIEAIFVSEELSPDSRQKAGLLLSRRHNVLL